MNQETLPKPKLIIGGRAQGKTTRLLNLMKDKEGIFVCHNAHMAESLSKQWNHIEGFKDIKFVSPNGVQVQKGKHVEAVAIDNWFMMDKMWHVLDFAVMSAVEIFVSINDLFDIEVLKNRKEIK